MLEPVPGVLRNDSRVSNECRSVTPSGQGKQELRVSHTSCLSSTWTVFCALFFMALEASISSHLLSSPLPALLSLYFSLNISFGYRQGAVPQAIARARHPVFSVEGESVGVAQRVHTSGAPVHWDSC